MATIIKVPAKTGMMSLIGVPETPPHAWGNYFWLDNPEIRVLNFWAENLEAAVYRKILDDGQVQVRVYAWENKGRQVQACIIDDPRIPVEWYYNKLCFTGFVSPPIEIAKEIYGYLGDPHNELERFTDVEMYHARRGEIYNERGFVTRVIGAERNNSEELVKALLAKRA